MILSVSRTASWAFRSRFSILGQTPRQIPASGKLLSRLEQSGVLHALQVLIENAIGKAKQLLKASSLVGWARCMCPPNMAPEYWPCVVGIKTMLTLPGGSCPYCDVDQADLEEWNSAIGLRNRIVHDYMNIDMRLVLQLISQKQYQFLAGFLLSST